MITVVARSPLWPALVTMIAVVTVVPPLVTLTAVRTVAGLLGTLALHLFRRTLKAAQLLAQGFDLALVCGLLALRLFEKLQHLVHQIHRLAK